MGLKVGDLTAMDYGSGSIIGYLEHIDDNRLCTGSMTTRVKWSYGFHGGVSSYGLNTVENSVKKIPNKDIKKVGDSYYVREKCYYIEKSMKAPYVLIDGRVRGKYLEKGEIRIKNSKITSKIKELRNRNKPFKIFIIYKVRVRKGELDVIPFKFIIKTNLKSIEKITINT